MMAVVLSSAEAEEAGAAGAVLSMVGVEAGVDGAAATITAARQTCGREQGRRRTLSAPASAVANRPAISAACKEDEEDMAAKRAMILANSAAGSQWPYSPGTYGP